MNLNIAKIFDRRIRFISCLLFPVLLLYILISLGIFSEWVQPSLNGLTDDHIAADSTTYIYFADSFREGHPDPFVVGAMTTFPNNFWLPVLLAFLFKGTMAMVLVNYAMGVTTVLLLRKCVSVDMWLFLVLLLLNATTTISLLAVNKEVVDALAVAIYLFSREKKSWLLLLLAVVISLVNRFEITMIMIVFMMVESCPNPIRRRRALTLGMLVLGLSVLLPLLASGQLAARYEEASSAGVVNFLDQMELHYFYFVAVIPKVLENLFGEILNVSKFSSYSFSDPANSYFLLSNNLACAAVIALLVLRRRLSLKSDLVYFCAVGCVIMAISLVIQPRYFYFIYVLLCLKAAERKSESRPRLQVPSGAEPVHA